MFCEHLGRKKKEWITEHVLFILWSIWIPLHVLVPLERERERMRDWKRETQAPCLRSMGFGSLPAPFLKASPSASWVNNPKKSTQSTTSPTVNETLVYVWVKTVSHKTEKSPQIGFTVGIMLEVWLTGHLCCFLASHVVLNYICRELQIHRWTFPSASLSVI